jgi:hypothetical protein
MVKHIVLHRFRHGVPQENIGAMYQKISGLRERISGILSFEGGPNVCREGRSKGYTHGFVMTFVNEQARNAYGDHPVHLDLIAEISPLLDGSLEDAVLKLDFAAPG